VRARVARQPAPGRREPLPRRREALAIAAFGVLFLGVYSVTLNAAERRVDAGTAAMVVNTGPILIAVLAGIGARVCDLVVRAAPDERRPARVVR